MDSDFTRISPDDIVDYLTAAAGRSEALKGVPVVCRAVNGDMGLAYNISAVDTGHVEYVDTFGKELGKPDYYGRPFATAVHPLQDALSGGEVVGISIRDSDITAEFRAELLRRKEMIFENERLFTSPDSYTALKPVEPEHITLLNGLAANEFFPHTSIAGGKWAFIDATGEEPSMAVLRLNIPPHKKEDDLGVAVRELVPLLNIAGESSVLRLKTEEVEPRDGGAARFKLRVQKNRVTIQVIAINEEEFARCREEIISAGRVQGAKIAAEVMKHLAVAADREQPEREQAGGSKEARPDKQAGNEGPGEGFVQRRKLKIDRPDEGRT